jgi:hypothetical protein
MRPYPGDKIVFQKGPGAAGFGAGHPAGFGFLAQALGTHVEKVGGGFQVERAHGVAHNQFAVADIWRWSPR